ncbi:MAG: DNA alkylation repair protein [Flavobacteriales bacterium]|nr:DNA alkylation repair protein [Flavobacteriales bacterium]
MKKDFKEAENEVIAYFKENGNEAYRKKMEHFGINADKAVGVSMVFIRSLAKKLGKNTEFGRLLWFNEIHEVKILSSLIINMKDISCSEMNSMVAEFYSWDLCDFVCGEFALNPKVAYGRILPWANDEREYVRRAAFSLIARLAMRDKHSDDTVFLSYLPVIESFSMDSRPMVRKAVDWALRQIGKRSFFLHEKALFLAEKMSESEDKNTRWVGGTAKRELKLERVIKRLK